MSRLQALARSRSLLVPMGLAIVGVFALGLITVATDSPAVAGNGTTARFASPASSSGDDNVRLLTWSGLRWVIYPNDQKGPENVPMTNSPRAAWVDGKGWLHLKIVKVDGQWRSVELQSLYPVTYGTFRMVNDTATANFADSVVLGMFVYHPHASQYTDEIDIENSRFPKHLKAPNNAQFAIQPYYSPNHYHAYAVDPSYVPLRQQFTWYPPLSGTGRVDFETRVGNTKAAPLLSRWTFTGYDDPNVANGKMYLYLNLWLNKNRPPVGGTHSAIIRSVTITPLGD